MDDKHMHRQQYTVRDFLPLIGIFSLILLITGVHQWYYGWHLHEAMRIMMASFFLVFGGFKVINLAGFAEAYSKYDLIANRLYVYGFVYPFIELGLGFAYVYRWQLVVTNWITLVLMLVSAAGVFNELRKGNRFVCACLGVLFTVPMTYVTLAEDLLMAAMAAWMLFG